MIVGIIQARMGSNRLPGKVLMKINDMPLLKYQLDRVSNSKKLDKIIVATTTNSKDDGIYNYCIENNFECFRGDEDDVLSRYYDCAKKYNAKIVVRMTADCPLLDPVIIDRLIDLFKNSEVDYASNTAPPENSRFPDGSDVEVFSMEALVKANDECKDKHDREHVTFHFWKYSNNYKTIQLDNNENNSKYRFTVDYPEDFQVVEFIFNQLQKKNLFGHVDEIIAILEDNPEKRDLNSMYYAGIGWEQNKYKK